LIPFKFVFLFSSFFLFLKHTFYFFLHYSTCHSLYPRPKAWDAAAVRARKYVYIFIRNFLMIVPHERICARVGKYQSGLVRRLSNPARFQKPCRCFSCLCGDGLQIRPIRCGTHPSGRVSLFVLRTQRNPSCWWQLLFFNVKLRK
jgi:hypothetical protein